MAFAQFESGEFEQTLRTTDRLRQMAAGLTASELAPATAMAGVSKIITGRRAEGGRDLQVALDIAHDLDPVSYAIAVAYKSDLVTLGFELVDEALVNETREALLRAESFGDAYGLSLARWAHGAALLRSGDRDRGAGIELLHQSRSEGIDIFGSVVDADVAAEMARQGRRDESIDTLRAAVRSEIDAGDRLFVGCSTAVLVQLLVGRGAATDLGQARDIVAQLEAQLPSVPEPALELWPLHCRAMLAKAVSDADSDAEIVNRYRDLAEELDARGHLAVVQRLAAEPAFGG